ncbi:hypothetical protein BJX99DRAFT_242940 [Aspergillus californicus]
MEARYIYTMTITIVTADEQGACYTLPLDSMPRDRNHTSLTCILVLIYLTILYKVGVQRLI